MHGRTAEGDEVWRLHLAFVDAAKAGDVVYAPDDQASAQIMQFTMHHEAELALVDILANTTSSLPSALLEQAVQAARGVWTGVPEQVVRDQVAVWLQWYPGRSIPPPFGT